MPVDGKSHYGTTGPILERRRPADRSKIPTFPKSQTPTLSERFPPGQRTLLLLFFGSLVTNHGSPITAEELQCRK